MYKVINILENSKIFLQVHTENKNRNNENPDSTGARQKDVRPDGTELQVQNQKPKNMYDM